MKTTKAMLELKAGVDSALGRLLDVGERRRIETILIKHEADENDSGWSEEEWDAVKPAGRPKAIARVDFDRLFRTIGQIARMQEFILDYYANPVPIAALVQFFQPDRLDGPTTRIETLRMRHLNLVGGTDDFRAFSDSLRNPSASNITTVCITSCKAQDLGTSDALIRSLSSLSSLKDLTLEEMDMSGESLAAVCLMPTLTCLRLRHVSASNHRMHLITEAMRTTQKLQSLQVRYALDQTAAQSFFQLLEDNSSLKEVDIDMDSWSFYGTRLARALRSNTNLSNLEMNVFGKDPEMEANAAALAESLVVNTTLKRLCLTFHSRLQEENPHDYVERLKYSFVGPFDRTMSTNIALGELLVGPVHQRVTWSPRTRLNLTLNQAGRQQLLKLNEASRKTWVETLIRYRHDLDVLYYFLSMNPSLTDVPTSMSSPSLSVSSDVITEPRYKRMKWSDSKRTMG